MQRENVKGSRIKIIDRDLDIQIKKRRAAWERVILLIYVNGDPLRNNLYKKLERGPMEWRNFLINAGEKHHLTPTQEAALRSIEAT